MKENFFRSITSLIASPLRIILLFATVLVFGGLFYAAAAFRGLEETLVREIRTANETSDRLKQNLSLLSRDSNEIRSALGLPERTYPPLDFEDEEKVSSEGEARGGTDILFYRAVENLLSHSEKSHREKRFNEMLDSAEMRSLPGVHSFRFRRSRDGAVLERGGTVYFTLSPERSGTGFEVKTYTGKILSFKDSTISELTRFIDEETRILTAHFQDLAVRSRTLEEILRDVRIRNSLGELGLVAEPITETQDAFQSRITLLDERSLVKMTAGLDKRSGSFFLDGSRYGNPDAFREGLFEAFKSIDLRTSDEIRVEKIKLQIDELFADSGFLGYLNSKKLTLSREPREEEEYFYYDFLDSSGKRVGALGIQKKFGEIYLFDGDNVSLGSLKMFSLQGASRDAKKKVTSTEGIPAIPAFFGGKPARTFLIAGAHERMTDAIILAAVNESRNEINMVSLPRDLFYRSRKLNSIYYRYGGERFAEEVSAVTGIDIEHYIIIDMFAFIDAINILGGIEITLDEDLVDPTYRVRDAGRWSTLFYPAGRHHLNGIEALRVARSRHFTSDFGRAQRQQELISSIKDKMTGLGLGDIGKIYDLVQVLSKYVDTNLTPFEIVNSFLKYGTAKVASRTVLDTDNILYHAYTNLKYLNLEEDAVDENFDKGAYILLPLEDDWSLLRRFIRSLLEGPAA